MFCRKTQPNAPGPAPCPDRGPLLMRVDDLMGCGCAGVVVHDCLRHQELVSLRPIGGRGRRTLEAEWQNFRGRDCATCQGPGGYWTPSGYAVVVTSHNYGRYLRECLDSILAQTTPAAEVIVVDDSSDDDTPAICREYAARRVRYLRGEWRDVALARNAGAAGLQTGYLLFVDADNRLPPNYVEVLLSGMATPIGVTYAHLQCFDDQGHDLGRSPAIKPFSLEALRRQNLADTCSLVHRQAFEQVGGWASNAWGLHDWDLWLRIVSAGWKMRLVEGTSLDYRVHASAMSHVRHGRYQSGADISRDSTLTTIVTLFSGRGWMLDRWFAALAAQRWNHGNLHLVAMDNSRDPSFAGVLKARLEACGVRYTYLRDDSRIVETQAAAEFTDSAESRTGNNYPFNAHLARLYATAGRYLPADTAKVWSIEDDVEVPPDALATLATELFRLQDAGAVSACLRSRFEPMLIAYVGGKAISKVPDHSRIVDKTGFYCLLLRREAWDAIAWRPGATMSEKWPYYDWAACHDLLTAGHQIYLCPVRCGHWQADGACLLP